MAALMIGALAGCNVFLEHEGDDNGELEDDEGCCVPFYGRVLDLSKQDLQLKMCRVEHGFPFSHKKMMGQWFL